MGLNPKVKAKARPPLGTAAEIADAVKAGDRRALARAITLIESTRHADRATAEELVAALAGAGKPSIRIGISGVPGVGKSTLIEAFGLHIIEAGHRLAVLAVDPSSPRTGGSILGDKTRMEELGRHAQAFIRPSPAGRSLGGVARRTRESITAVEAAGFDVVLVETVGVGQSEYAVADLVDMFVLLVAPGGGDDLQGIKKGIVELAELIAVTKADGDLAPAAQRAQRDYAAALQLLRPAEDGWMPKVLTCSAMTGAGIAELWQAVEAFRDAAEESGRLERRRAEQAAAAMWSEVTESLLAELKADRAIAKRAAALEAEVRSGEAAPGEAARQILAAFRGNHADG